MKTNKPLSSLKIYQLLKMEDPDKYAEESKLRSRQFIDLYSDPSVYAELSIRRSGRTTRKIIDALSEYTITGNPVVVTAPHEANRKYITDVLLSFCSKLDIEEPKVFFKPVRCNYISLEDHTKHELTDV